jgi:O-phosphoseryl-tRNA(Cys) synthetase
MQILVLAIYSVAAIMALMARNVVQDVSDNVRGSVQSIQTLKADVDIYVPQVTDPELKKALQKLSETIRYSDPMSNAAVADIEGQIMQNMNDLRVRIENTQNREAVQICRDIEVLFLQRNSLLKATK